MQTFCYWILQISSEFHQLFRQILGGYMEGTPALRSTRWPCFPLLASFDLHGGSQNTDLAAVTQVSPNYLSFRFMGTVLLWKLSEVFLFHSLCAKTKLPVSSKIQAPFPSQNYVNFNLLVSRSMISFPLTIQESI